MISDRVIPDRVRLPLTFDPAPLAAEALALEGWVPHFNRDVYEGQWSGVSLRSVGGRPDRLYPDPAANEPYADTPTLDLCPAHRGVLDNLGCRINAARLLRLDPRAEIKEHRDYVIGWEEGEIRIHVPVVTDDGVEFVIGGRPVTMAAGEAWYLDVTKPHRVVNRSDSPRIHLVVDCILDEGLAAMVQAAAAGI
jgi:Aspartyl/Asparaginyl beta-hydroxylase